MILTPNRRFAEWREVLGDPVVATAPTLTDAEIAERMSGNICRCAAYPNIVAAIRDVATGGRG